ncbi:MAG: DUF4194 domain-containing protein [Planctomycetota bacterium]|nr:DUF4194 domain-containing protein [Planctomycetota bacterium]
MFNPENETEESNSNIVLQHQDYGSNNQSNSESSSDTSYEAWSGVAVRLLQGVVYHDDNQDNWNTLLRSVSPLTDYFSKIGLLLIVNESDGMAYLRQANIDDLAPDQGTIPKLFRRVPLGFEATLLSVLLRDELRQFEEEDLSNERCVIAQHDLLVLWQAFFPEQTDEVRLTKMLVASLRKLEDLKFVRQFESEPPSWEVRRILKARLPLDDLERLRATIVENVSKGAVLSEVTQDSEGEIGS